MDRAAFYGAARHSFGPLEQSQVNGFEAILDEAVKRETPLQHLAYMLATAWHETAFKMQPIEEIGKGRGRSYGKALGPFKKVYYGRGFVQLTWLSNYEHAGEKLGVDLVQFPEKALELPIAAEIMFAGMSQGWFTGKKLANYIGPNGADYHDARRVINGTDCAAKIAGYARSFEGALRAAGY
jgi:putative chitinase